MKDKPHIKWSTYWGAWECKFAGVARIGDTPLNAYHVWKRAALAGNKR